MSKRITITLIACLLLSGGLVLVSDARDADSTMGRYVKGDGADRDEGSAQGRQRPRDDREETIVYKVLVNDKEQYSIWPADRENPTGWQDAGFKGTRGECLVFLDKVWEKMRRFSLKPKPTPGATPTASPTPEPTPPPDEAQKTQQKQVNEVRDKLLELRLIRQQEDKVALDRITREVYQILERLNPKPKQSADGFIQWLSFTGEYRFRRRGGSPAGGTQTGGTQTGGEKPADEKPPTGTGEITGTGKLVMKGCIITLTHNAPDRRVFATLDACNKTGSAEVQVNPDKTKVEIKDSNTADNTCGSKK